MTQDTNEQALRDAILKTISEQKPESADQLIQQLQRQFPTTSSARFAEAIIGLQNEDKLHFAVRPTTDPDLGGYLTTNQASWYWITLGVTIATVISAFLIPESAFPFVVIRYVLGAIFILWLPGYTFIKALFPVKSQAKTTQKSLDTTERTVLSIGMSIALVPIVGLLLNYTPWGITLTPIVMSLAALTLAFATTALVREFQSRNVSFGGKPATPA